MEGAEATLAPSASVWSRLPVYAWVVFTTAALCMVVAAAYHGTDAAGAAGSIGVIVASGAAGVLFIRKARDLEAERRAWTLVGVGLLLNVAGVVLIAVLFLATGDAPTFGPVDLLFLLGYAVAIVGLASLPHSPREPLQRLRVGLDGVIGAVSIAALFWVAYASEIIAGVADSSLWERLIGSTFPLLDLAMIVIIMIVIVRRSSYRFDVRLSLFALAVLLQAIGDVSYYLEGAGSSFADANALFAVFVAASATFFTTSLIVDRVPEPRAYADRDTPLWALLAPYSAAGVMVFVLLFRLSDSVLDSGDRILLMATLAVAVLVIVRQAVAIRENRIAVVTRRNDLVSSISHELRTPLTAMLGFLAVLDYNEVSGPAERAELIGVVHHQANYLAGIVEDLILLAEDDPNQMSLSLGPVNIRSVVDSAINATTVDRTRVKVVVDDRELVAHVDGARIQQVLVNLISNAGRYGGGRCLVTAYQRGGTLVLEVHDAGPGVAKRHEENIWNRFERGDYTHVAGHSGTGVEGTGIGLAVVQSIAKAHGGFAGYRRSELPEMGGACFYVEFPGRVDTKAAPVEEVHAKVSELRTA